MTDHPCKGLTQTQREVFEQIAINQPPQCGWKSIDALLKAGVIERGKKDAVPDLLMLEMFLLSWIAYRQLLTNLMGMK